MKKEIKHWVKFLAPGSFVAEDWNRDIKHLDPESIEWPDNAYAFQFYEREDMVDGETRYKGESKQIGPTYYHPASRIETLDQVRANPNKGPCLVSNMECNKWDRVIWSRWGNWPQPFDAAKMTVLPANANGGNWDLASDEWRAAAEKWRDPYHELLHNKQLSTKENE